MRPAPDGYRVTDLDAWAASSTLISDDEVRELAEGGLARCGLELAPLPGKNITRITISVPLPPAGCAQNTHCHWRSKAKDVKIAREEAFNAGMGALIDHGPIDNTVIVHHTWYMARDGSEKPKRYRPLDEGNAIGALKATIDGLVEAGLLANGDSHTWVKWGNGLLFRTAKDHGGRSEVELVLDVQ